MPKIYLSIGSNIDPEMHFQQCATTLEQAFSGPVWSPVYRSAAVGMDADDFLNAVVLAHTTQSIETTIKQLKQIEFKHGRVRSTNKFTSRTLDIDLLVYGELVIDTVDITIPRAELTTAAYILKPLADVAPDGVHPVANKTYSELFHELEQIQPESISNLNLVSLNLET